ncbi:MAG: peptide chain release factor 2 [Candidatus Omnitrophica bacterium]|nr:peptide chain release factor 2 [Candidatus Omnitrophota bacterium]
MLAELREIVKDMANKFDELRGYLDLEKNSKRITELENEFNSPEIWKNKEKADSFSKELKALRSVINPYNKVKDRFTALEELLGIVEENDADTLASFRQEAEEIRKIIDELEFKCILGGEADRCDAIVSINAGAGGTESCDWVSMLLRMYLQWAWKRSFSSEVIDELPGEEAGIKNTTFIIKGEYAYGYLKSEIGVHRLVRISPFDSNKRRHTSFASVDVIPEIEDNIKIDINESDLKVDTYRSSGAGGQHVNVTDSAVRITHLPTGIVVQCQKERSQHKNKATAMKVLRAKLYEEERQKRDESLMRKYSDKKKIEWGSQIRSYVLHPYKMVKDHRTDEETSSAEKVLDGDIERFVAAYLKKIAAEK